MGAHRTTPNGSTSLALEAQRLLKSHADIMELFNSSNDRKK